MNKLQIMKKVSTLAGPKGLALVKASPEILVAAGVVGVVASTVLACRATLRVESILDDHIDKKNKINAVYEDIRSGGMEDLDPPYTDKDFNKDKLVLKVQTVTSVARVYTPAVVLGVVSLACILKSHSIMKTRNMALMAAYKGLDEGFRAYRKRVVEEFGEEKDYMYKNGLRAETIMETETDENGKAKKVKKEVLVKDDPNNLSVYAKFFDETCGNWSKTPEYNMLFLRGQQNYMNTVLQAKGYVFLNEVYDVLGIDQSRAGAVTGWSLELNPNSYIDFGLYDGRERSRAFVNGHERSILLDFNVDGVILDTPALKDKK